MKRYRLLNVDFDTRARVLAMIVPDTWAPNIQGQWRANQRQIRDELLAEHGLADADRKLRDFIELGAAPFSMIAFHNKFMRQARTAFVSGAYYPALTAACALGERVLNHLVLTLRSDFKGTSQYRRVHRKVSFDDWTLAIDTLLAWEILTPQAAARFRELETMRHRAIHFRPETDTDDRALALNAISLLTEIVEAQFGPTGPVPWMMTGAIGAVFVKRDHESRPFVRRVVLPRCAVVTPFHELRLGPGGWTVVEPRQVEGEEVSDEEFVRLYNEAHG